MKLAVGKVSKDLARVALIEENLKQEVGHFQDAAVVE